MAIAINGSGTITGITAGGLPDDVITTADIAADCVDGTKIADNGIDSEHYTDGSIDEAHIAADAVNFATHLKAGTDGELITWDASGNPAAVAVGTATHVLTSGGTGVAPTFAAAGGAEFDTGLFTHDISVTGTQAVTGVGFQPTHLIFFANVQNSSKMSVGFDDGTTDNGVGSEHAGTAGRWTADGSSIYLYHSSGNAARGTISALGADGFTITWSKTGSPTGSAMTAYMAFK